MKISIEEVDRILQMSVDPREQIRPRGDEASASQEDRNFGASEVSDTAGEVQRVTQLVNSLPDSRDDLVQQLKAQIESGAYHVSGEDIADLIVRRTFADRMR